MSWQVTIVIILSDLKLNEKNTKIQVNYRIKQIQIGREIRLYFES